MTYSLYSQFHTPRHKKDLLAYLLPRWEKSWGFSKTDIRKMGIVMLKKFYKHRMFIAIGDITRKKRVKNESP